MIIDTIVSVSNALIAAWLPGTSGGQGIIDAIDGDYIMRPGGSTSRVNSLSVDWISTMVNMKLILERLEKFSCV